MYIVHVYMYIIYMYMYIHILNFTGYCVTFRTAMFIHVHVHCRPAK